MEIEYIELYPNVHVYTNLMPDAQELYEIMKESEQKSYGKYFLRNWEDWSYFGTYSQKKEIDESVEFGEIYNKEKFLEDRLTESYSKALDHYLKICNVELPDGYKIASNSFCKYKERPRPETEKLAMQYHTDFIKSERDMPGRKFLITCTAYINDNYEGGNVEFYITDSGKKIHYRPKAGEIMIFPSGEPYYHGVTNILNGEKFFVRNFVLGPKFEGTKEWLENQREVGAWNWFIQEKTRLDYENPRNMIYFYNDEIVPFEKWQEIQNNQ